MHAHQVSKLKGRSEWPLASTQGPLDRKMLSATADEIDGMGARGFPHYGIPSSRNESISLARPAAYTGLSLRMIFATSAAR
jgi:hypothetical protein